MGAIWIAVPFERKLTDWVLESGVAIPPGTPEARLPTLLELEGALAALPTLHVSDREVQGEEWRFDIATVDDRAGPWTVLRAKPEPSGELSLGFFKGWDGAVLEVSQAIAAISGPLVVVADYEGTPTLVTTSGVYPSGTAASD